ncbi:MAG: DUF2397 family protein [Candidatus Wallbacteria bacterium]|nr:DUF2397 family protein [Candidatus Wallbacteria bacterium]
MERSLFRPFAHLVADNTQLYRAILRLFTEAKDRFALNLRPQEIWRHLQEQGQFPELDLVGVDRALARIASLEALEIEGARVRLALEHPVRLSCLGLLDRSAFGLFLDLRRFEPASVPARRRG